MANDLAAVMVRETDVDPARIDEALERQVVGGGGLDTALMEMGLIDEERLLPLLEKVYGLPSIGREDIRKIDPGAVAVFPQRLAEKHGIVPLELSGRRLSVVVAHKPDLTLLDEIGFMLSVYVRPFVTTEARLAYGLYRLYGVQLPPRMESLLGMMGEDPVAELEEEREAAGHPEPPAEKHDDEVAVNAAAAAEQAALARDDAAEEPPAGKAAPSGTPGNGATAGAWQVEGTGDAHLSEGDASEPTFKFAPARSESVLLGSRPADDDESEHADTEAPAATSASEPTEAEREAVRAKLLADVDAQEAADKEKADARRTERVRWTVDDAIAELAMADDRDAMVDVVLRFAHRRLTTAAMFVAHRDHFSGWDIIDPALDRGDITSISVPVTGEHVLAKLHEMRSPSLGTMGENDPLGVALGRQPRAVLLVPVMVESKLAAVLYGDCGEKSIPPSSLAELHMVAPRFGKALRNLILRQRQALSGEAAPATSGVEDTQDILPAAQAQGELPAIELDLEDFDEVLEPSSPGRPAPPMAGAASDDDDDEAFEVDADAIEEEAPAEAAEAADAEHEEDAHEEDEEDDIETTDLEDVEVRKLAAAARADAEAMLVAAQSDEGPAIGEDVTDDDLDAALNTMSSASEGSFAEADHDDDAVAKVASVVGVDLDDDFEADAVPPAAPSPAAEVADAEEEKAPDDADAVDDGEDVEEEETGGQPRLSPKVGAVADELLGSDEALLFKHAYDERDPSTPPPIPRLKRKAKNRGRIAGAPGPTRRAPRPGPATPRPSATRREPGPAAVDAETVDESVGGLIAEPAAEQVDAPAVEQRDEASIEHMDDAAAEPVDETVEAAEADGAADEAGVQDDEASVEVAEASVEVAEASVEVAEASVEVAKASVEVAEASVEVVEASVAERPAEPTAEPVVDAEPAAAELVAEVATEPPADGAVARSRPPGEAVVAASPGADARDTLLLATWRDWISHETPDVDDQLIDLQQGGEAGRAAINRVVGYGDEAMPALARYFPGVLEVHPFGHMDSRPDVRDFSDALSCLVRLGADRAAPILVAEINSDDRLHRYAAAWALSELRVSAALKSLAQRVFDPEYRIALLVLEVLNGYRDQPAFPKIIEQLRRMVKQGNEFERKRAILAVSELKDRDALSHLVDLLGTRPKDIAEEAHRALVNLTKQEFGGSGRRWRAWVADHGKSHRIEWLIGGLAHKNEEIRREAQAELNQLTGQYHGYRYDAPRAERDQSVQRWRTWWADEADPSAFP
jgi:hypothetical protein